MQTNEIRFDIFLLTTTKTHPKNQLPHKNNNTYQILAHENKRVNDFVGGYCMEIAQFFQEKDPKYIKKNFDE